jgi:S1-C subfamily serine protease
MFNAIGAIAIIATVWTNANAPVIGVTCSRETQGQPVVEQVLPGSPAEKADVRPGDVIVKYNNSDVADFKQLLSFIRAGKVGDTVILEILRGETRMAKSLTLGPHPDVK